MLAKPKGAGGIAGGDKQLLRMLFSSDNRLNWQECTVTGCAGKMGHSRTHLALDPDPGLHLLSVCIKETEQTNNFSM